ncbi:MAG: symmetrical bis(5'-nucleosyl)-tetraphosphatase [Acidobacteriota bacterium]|nr:symmetrical bis(5'-nucleosyl)-tetraphosphatase [Acidobacteriota bacterium]MDQ7087754.1 symmetrical bis(5'-nucleosyl)-tetraphosphatase [Acidobacteriota bacterium]
MATFVIGDIHGCAASLDALLGRLPMGATDRLWQVGDLVNRGPNSSGVLRWAMDQGSRLVTVLGNHELAILARYHLRGSKGRDELAARFGAKLLPAVIEWITARPLLYVEGDKVLVHAGVLPCWSRPQTEDLARDAHAALAGALREPILELLFGGTLPRKWKDNLPPAERHAFVIQTLTRLRMVESRRRPVFPYTGSPDQAPSHYRAWFERQHESWDSTRIFFGHWAALGLHLGRRAVGLDTGCVYGGRLSAIDRDGGKVYQVERQPGDV